MFFSRKLSKADFKAIRSGMKQYAKLGDRFNLYRTQDTRFYKDSIVGELLGIQEMNMANSGWDGVFKNGKFFENKNNSIFNTKGFRLTFQDTSDEKVEEMRDGVIVANTYWLDAATPGFIMIGNTKNVIDRLSDINGPRKTSSASFTDCLNGGFKIVAVGLTKNEVLDVLRDRVPMFAANLTTDDIYKKKNIPSLVKEMM